MNKNDTKQLRSMVLQYFQCLSSGENYVQCMKEALFIHDQFNPLLIFDMVSVGKQLQTKRDWKNYLHQINVEFSEDEFRYLFTLHKFSDQVKFHQFMEAFMPFNADVLRVFKKNYIELVEIQKRDQQVDQIFAELIKFEIQFCRKLIKIKNQISQHASSQNIINLVKQDLVFENHKRGFIRESVKFKEKFQSPAYELGFDELRRFLQLWLNQKQINIEFELLQIKRHLGNASPFKYIVLKSEGDFSPLKKRSYSVSKLSSKKFVASGTNIKQKASKEKQKYSSGNRYQDFKTDLLQGLARNNELAVNKEWDNKFDQIQIRQEPYSYERKGSLAVPSGVARNIFTKQSQSIAKEKEISGGRQDYLRNLRYARDKTCINGTYIVNILQEISRKEQRVERLRKKLANCFEFNLINLFKLVDFNNKGFVTPKNIHQYLNSSSQKQFALLVEYHGRQADKLKFQDFCMIFRPLSKKLNEMLDEKPQNILPNPFKRQTLSLISQILTLSAEMFNNIQSTRRQINNDGVNVSNLFKYVDVRNKGYIDAEDIQDLLEEKRIECDQRILKGIMKIFRKRLTDKISYQDFQNFIDM